jgi:hypothetical protein
MVRPVSLLQGVFLRIDSSIGNHEEYLWFRVAIDLYVPLSILHLEPGYSILSA